jgi:hypothetical protein
MPRDASRKELLIRVGHVVIDVFAVTPFALVVFRVFLVVVLGVDGGGSGSGGMGRMSGGVGQAGESALPSASWSCDDSGEPPFGW